jgi:hypothetical protein
MRRKLISIILAALYFMQCWCCPAQSQEATSLKPTESERLFLDRLMMAESGGRQDAKNPSSSALGAFQFIQGTFLDIVQRNWPEVAQGKSQTQLLELRTDPTVSRNAALIYTRESAAFLAARGIALSAANLRLAFFVGPSGAMKVLTAQPDEPLTNVLGRGAIAANPFLNSLTVSQLIERASREAGAAGALPAPQTRTTTAAGLKINVSCNLKLPSCRKWVALAKKRLSGAEARLISAPSPK